MNTTKKKKMTTKELILNAMGYAIQDRLSYLDAIKGCGMNEAEEDVKQFIAMARQYMKKQRAKRERINLSA